MTMAGLERPDRGKIFVDGQRITAMGEDALARFRGQRIGIVFQSFQLIPTMTALENVAAPLELAGARDAFARAARRTGAGRPCRSAAHYPAQLSGGEQQRVALARALAPRPSLIIADEPTGNLDEATGGAIIDLLFARAPRAARRWRWSPTIRRSPRAATEPCACVRASSKPQRRRRSRHERALRPAAVARRAPALLRFALRDLRGGLAGLRIFLVCIALGVAAIVGVNSLARSLEDGWRATGGRSSAATPRSR